MAEWLEYGAAISSIISLMVTIWILGSIRRISREFLLRARIPQILRSLQKNASELSKLLKDVNNVDREVVTRLSLCEAVLKDLRGKIKRDLRRSSVRLLSKIKAKKGNLSPDDAWDIYNDLQALIESLKYFREDIKWSR